MEPPHLAGETVLVTGGAGFIGSHIASALVADNEVRVLDDLSAGDRSRVPAGATLYDGDVRDQAALREAVDGVDVVFHEAARVSVSDSVEAPSETNSVNLTGTLRVLEAARREDARVVFASSAAIYGEPTAVPIPEDEPTDPTSPYGVQKLAGDHYVRLYHDLFGLDTVALRYFNVYGPGQGSGGDYSGVITVFVRQAVAGGPITVHGDGTQTRDFVHVSDVVQANLLAATTPHVGEAYNVASGQAITIRRLAETVSDVVDSDAEVVFEEPRQGDIDASEADIGKARRQLGYDPQRGLAEGLADLVDS
ncbi:MAG: NAD-dependent epimerase/dehydratase family protein [Halobacteriaceae archaeon]